MGYIIDIDHDNIHNPHHSPEGLVRTSWSCYLWTHHSHMYTAVKMKGLSRSILTEFLAFFWHRSTSPSEASSFLNYPFSWALFVIVLCLCILTLTFLMRRSRGGKWNEPQSKMLRKRVIQDFCVRPSRTVVGMAPGPVAVLHRGPGCTLYFWAPVIYQARCLYFHF